MHVLIAKNNTTDIYNISVLKNVLRTAKKHIVRTQLIFASLYGQTTSGRVFHLTHKELKGRMFLYIFPLRLISYTGLLLVYLETSGYI